MTRLERLRADLAEWVRVRPKWRHIPTRTDDLAALLAVADAARARTQCVDHANATIAWCGSCVAELASRDRLAAALAALDGAAEEGA